MRNSYFKLIIAIWIVISAAPVYGQVLPYLNPDLPSEKRAEDLLSRLTLDEK